MTNHPERPGKRKVAALGIGAALLTSTVLGGAVGAYATIAAVGERAGSAAPPAAFHRAAFTPGTQTSLADMVEAVSPAVVQVQAQTRPRVAQSSMGELFEQFHGRRMPQRRGGQAMGSGFIVDASGLVVTNAHVIAGADAVTVKLADGRELSATVAGRDDKTDLAVLRVRGGGQLPAVAWGESGRVRVGEDVFAVGSPFGLGNTVTKGIVSSRGRSIGAGPYDDFLQIDAPINSGNSGGPLFDAAGKVIGVNTAIFSPSGGNVGIGFAIPSDMAREVVTQLATKGAITRGQIGVAIQEVTPEVVESLGLASAKGALVADVTAGSPAQQAGLRAGDVVRSFGGTAVDRARDLPRAVAKARIGERVPVVVIREGRTLTLPVRVGSPADASARLAQPGSSGVASETPRLGVQVAPASPALNAEAGQPQGAAGVMVMEVDPSGRAAARGLVSGDIIVAVNTAPVATADALAAKLRQAAQAGRKHVLLDVMRSGTRALVTVPIG